jgi:hypothetical protein
MITSQVDLSGLYSLNDQRTIRMITSRIQDLGEDYLGQPEHDFLMAIGRWLDVCQVSRLIAGYKGLRVKDQKVYLDIILGYSIEYICLEVSCPTAAKLNDIDLLPSMFDYI